MMRMVQVGGTLFLTTPANNLCGHGFYQFSPELMFRVFNRENGFELRRVVMLECRFPSVELAPVRRAYEVTDPAAVRQRVGLVSKGPVMMMVEAKKVADASPFASMPQQSDYVALWRQGPDAPDAPGGAAAAVPPTVRGRLRASVGRVLHRYLPESFWRLRDGYFQKRLFSFSNYRFYKRL
jgi:hypothetical protein